jgi:alpha-galactosidase
LQGSGVKYLVIDAGWYKGDEGVWHLGQGDWVANHNLFPHGLAATSQAIRERGLIPGIWFEMEVVGNQSPRFEQDQAHFLTRDGLPVTASGRRFWDFRDPWVIDYLSEKVIGQLKEAGLSYIKVDYNETIGLGCDGAESLGEGLRHHLQGVQDFFRKMRAELPDLVIENCASGGHRLEPSFMSLTSMASFSDAHETRDIPVIAASLHRLILPRQSQIWAVLHATDTTQRMVYLLTGGFLGRLCLSGEITRLDEEQWALVKEAIQFYGQVAPVIARGTSRIYQQINPSWQHLQGAQAVSRLSEDGQSVLIVTHSFGMPLPESIHVPLPVGDWHVAGSFPKSTPIPQIVGNDLCYQPAEEWESFVWYLKRD